MIQHQPYDHALKSLMGNRAAEIIPELVPDARLIREENVEIKRELLRADLVYLIDYRGETHVLNLELQTGSDSEMALRMLRYHVELLIDYRKPVISVVLYLFEASVPDIPFKEMSGEEALLTFTYRPIALWKLDAREYVQKRIIGMYTLLPGMKGANAALLLQAIRDMEQQFPRPEFARHLRRFDRILRRSRTVSEQDKKIVEEYMDIHYDSLLDEDPEIQEREARAMVQGLQQTVVEAVESEYPSLVELAQERVVHIDKPELLRQMLKQIYKASDENTARWVLNTFGS